jgi:predicted CopG family antitoxin
MVKTITIREEIYRKLLTIKKKHESFSELFERLVENRILAETLTRLRGAVEFKDKERMLHEIHSAMVEQR